MSEILAEWKKRHGLDPNIDLNADELRMIAEEQASKASSWCYGCDREMPVREMRLVTRRVNPYIQCDENPGDYIREVFRVRMCPDCFDAHLL